MTTKQFTNWHGWIANRRKEFQNSHQIIILNTILCTKQFLLWPLSMRMIWFTVPIILHTNNRDVWEECTQPLTPLPTKWMYALYFNHIFTSILSHFVQLCFHFNRFPFKCRKHAEPSFSNTMKIPTGSSFFFSSLPIMHQSPSAESEIQRTVLHCRGTHSLYASDISIYPILPFLEYAEKVGAVSLQNCKIIL